MRFCSFFSSPLERRLLIKKEILDIWKMFYQFLSMDSFVCLGYCNCIINTNFGELPKMVTEHLEHSAVLTKKDWP